MEQLFEAKLFVNDAPIELTEWPMQFLAKTVLAAVSTLKGAEDIQSLELYLKQGKLRVIVNGDQLHITPFPNEIIANTLTGLVSSLKGVDRIDSMEITVEVF